MTHDAKQHPEYIPISSNGENTEPKLYLLLGPFEQNDADECATLISYAIGPVRQVIIYEPIQDTKDVETD